MSAGLPGEPCEEREDCQGGGFKILLSGGDERSKPESPPENPPAVGEAGERAEGAAGGPARSPPGHVSGSCGISKLPPVFPFRVQDAEVWLVGGAGRDKRIRHPVQVRRGAD